MKRVISSIEEGMMGSEFTGAISDGYLDITNGEMTGP